MGWVLNVAPHSIFKYSGFFFVVLGKVEENLKEIEVNGTRVFSTRLGIFP